MENRNIKKRLSVWAVIVVVLMQVPLIAMQFTTEVNWTAGDFVFAFVLLFGSALFYELATRNMKNSNRRIAVGLVIFMILAFVWVAAATDLDGVESHPITIKIINILNE
jgi:cation transport ATPase